MHHIKPCNNKEYFKCAMPDGDNTKSTVCYNNEILYVDAYTRNIVDKYGNSDLISLIIFIKKCYFTEAIKWLCEVLGLDYYSDPSEDVPDSLKWTKMIEEMSSEHESNEENEKLKPISEKILTYYKPYVNDMFLKDGISYNVQNLFEIGYDLQSNRITIPIRDELKSLVGVKGRLYKNKLEEWEDKYLYIEPCAKSKILYGLNITMQYIKLANKVFVVEAEKGTMQGFSNNKQNIVSIGSHKLSKWQVEKLTRLGVEEIIIAYDEDAYRYKNENGVLIKKTKEEFLIDYATEINKFIPQQKVSVMIDIDGTILNKKQSPTDDFEKFNYLYENRVYLR